VARRVRRGVLWYGKLLPYTWTTSTPKVS
jgi:hypothetical protein